MLIITDSTHNRQITIEEAINLELKLNVTRYAQIWRYIGDVLFDYANSKSNIKELTVTSEQYTFLMLLMTKSGWEACRAL